MADKKPQRFTIDADREGQEVPTLTKLLYSKNVVKSQGSPGSGRQGRGLDAGRGREQEQSDIMTLEPTLTVERPSPAPERPPGKVPEEIAAEFVVSQIGSNRPQPLNMGSSRGASADRRIMPAATPFSMPEVIRPTPLPKLATNTAAGAGIRAISEKTKIDSSLIFEDAGEAFVLRTIVAAGTERVTLWSGMEIAKAVFPDLLGRLAKFGFAEFSTLGTAGQGNFDRTTFRSAFQVKNGEWMTLVRVKSASGKDSLVALFSPTSIQMHIPAFHSAGMPGAKAA